MKISELIERLVEEAKARHGDAVVTDDDARRQHEVGVVCGLRRLQDRMRGAPATEDEELPF
jgi:hypothetical protein